jgi:hypothetical protein
MIDDKAALRARACIERALGIVPAKANVVLRDARQAGFDNPSGREIVVLCLDETVRFDCLAALRRSGGNEIRPSKFAPDSGPVAFFAGNLPVFVELRPAARKPGDKGGLHINKAYGRIVLRDK